MRSAKVSAPCAPLYWILVPNNNHLNTYLFFPEIALPQMFPDLVGCTQTRTYDLPDTYLNGEK